MNYPAAVTLIAGPPCAGKTHLAQHLAQSGDLVLDFDTIAREMGSPTRWLHPEPYRSEAEAQMRATLALLPGRGPRRAYVIRSAASGRARAIAARSISADRCIVVDPGPVVCHQRADQDHRPDGTHEQIDQWYAAWSTWSGDEKATQALSIFTR